NIGRAKDPEELVNGARHLVVAYQDGRPILLQQVAQVGFEPRVNQGDAGYMGGPAVVLRVQKQPGVNTLDLTNRIEQALADMRPFFPKGIPAHHLIFEKQYFSE